MSNTRIVQPKPTNPSPVRVIENVTIENAGWVDNTLASGFWYYDYSNSLIKNYMKVETNVGVEYSSVYILKAEGNNKSARLYSLTQPSTFICDFTLYGGGA